MSTTESVSKIISIAKGMIEDFPDMYLEDAEDILRLANDIKDKLNYEKD